MNLKQKLSRKLKKTGGFTLIEMLIVVAIIAILVAVSIPLVNSSLTKAKVATDDANERAAKGAAVAEFLLKDPIPTSPQTYCYDAKTGVATTPVPTPDNTPDYGKGTTSGADSLTTGATRTGHIHVTVNPDGTTKIEWIP